MKMTVATCKIGNVPNKVRIRHSCMMKPLCHRDIQVLSYGCRMAPYTRRASVHIVVSFEMRRWYDKFHFMGCVQDVVTSFLRQSRASNDENPIFFLFLSIMLHNF